MLQEISESSKIDRLDWFVFIDYQLVMDYLKPKSSWNLNDLRKLNKN